MTTFPSTKDMAHLIIFWNSTFRRGKLVFTQNNKYIFQQASTHSALIQTEVNHCHFIIEENEIVWNKQKLNTRSILSVGQRLATIFCYFKKCTAGYIVFFLSN